MRITRERSKFFLVACDSLYPLQEKYETIIERYKPKILMKGRHAKVRSIKFLLKRRQ